MKLLLVILLIGSHAFAQTETPPPTPATDEYGIPLKLQSPKKVSTDDAMKPKPSTAVLSGMQSGAAAELSLPKSTSSSLKSATTSSRKGQSLARAKTKAKSKKSKTSAKEAVAPEVLENQAVHELMLPQGDLSPGVLPTPATVRSQVDEVKNPIRPLHYRVGVSLQPFQPKGTMSVGNLQPYDMSAAGTNAMVALDGQWLPVHVASTPGLDLGAFASLGYAQFSLALRSPGGVSLDDTKLHVIKAQTGVTASYQLPKSPLWSLHANLGVGRLIDIQASEISYANSSSSVNFASVGVAGERSLGSRLSAYAAYDFRLALNRTTDGADVPNHNILIGFLGNFE